MSCMENNEFSGMGDVDVTFAEIYSLACGMDNELNFPRGSGILSIDAIISENETRTISNAPLDCEFNIFCEGGAIVIQCDFIKGQEHELDAAVELCDEYINGKTNDPDKQWILSMILVPLALDGVINIAFMGLTYYIRLSDNDTYRLVLVFDNTLTQIFGIEGEDIAGIKASIEAEFLREERRLDDEIYEAQLEYEKLARYNPFADSVINDYVENTEGDENKEGDHEKCRR